MNVRFYFDRFDRETGLPHIYGHDVRQDEVEEVLSHPDEDRSGREGSRVAIGRTASGRYLRVIYVPDPAPGSVFVITAFQLTGKPLSASPPEKLMSQSELPGGWDEERVRRVIAHYEQQTDDDGVAEDEAAFTSQPQTIMKVPPVLVPAVRELIARHEASRVPTASRGVGAGRTR